MNNLKQNFMHPKIKTATHQISFNLAEDYFASIYSEVESLGVMQYLHFLVVHDVEKFPIYFVCAEWFDKSTLEDSGPVLGAFSSTGHTNFGPNMQWGDIDLFALKAIDVVREKFGLADDGLTEGEAWALTHVLKTLQSSNAGSAPDGLADAYWQAMSKNDSRLVAYLRKSNVL